MLLEEFDNNETAILNPNNFYNKIDNFPKTCLSFFSKTLMRHFVNMFKPENVFKLHNSTAQFPHYKIKIQDTEIAVYQSPVGVGNFEAVIELGAKNLLLVGCCGCLKPEIDEYSIIIPTSAIRDEGTSYHYAPASDELSVKKELIESIESVFVKNNIS